MKITKHCCVLCFLCMASFGTLLYAKAAESATPGVTATSTDISASQGAEVNVNAVHVTATRVDRELMDVPMSVGVVTAEEIKKNPSNTIGELVKDIPGVELYSSSPGLIRIGIRGESDLRTLILVDGQRITEHKSMDSAPINIDPSQVERIEVIKGPASALYGSDAIGGVLNIITKKTTKDAIHGNVSITYTGANNGLTESASLYGHYQGWNYQLSASNSMHNKTVTPYGYIPQTGYSQQNFSGMLSYDFTPDFTVGLHTSYFQFDSVNGNYSYQNGEFIKLMDMGAGLSEIDFIAKTDDWTRFKAGAFLEAKNLSDSFAKLRVDVYYQNTYKDFYHLIGMDSPLGPMLPGKMVMVEGNYHNSLSAIGTSVQTDWTIGENHYLIFGYEFLHDYLDSDNTSYSKTPTTVGMPPSFLWNEEHKVFHYEGTQTTHSLYLSGESQLLDELTLHYGARYTGVITAMSRAEESINGGDFYDITVIGSKINQRVVFNAGLVWKPMEELAVRAHWGQGFRVPRLNEMYVDSFMAGTTVLGAPDLEPETSNNFEIGARYTKDNVVVDVAAFYNITDNYIASREVADDVYQPFNTDSAYTYGIEAVLSYTFDSGFRPYLSGTFMRRQYITDTYKTWDTNIPALSGRLGLAYSGSHFDDSVNINADLYMRGQTDSYDYKSETERDKYFSFVTFNFAAGIEFGPEKEWNIQAEVLNIFNTYYRDHTNYPTPVETGTSFNVRLSYSF